MKHGIRHKLHGSIFLQILLVILLTGFVVILLVGGFIKHFIHNKSANPFSINIQNYANYIVDDLGTPPDPVKADQFAKKLFINIRYEGSQTSWATEPGMLSIETAKKVNLCQVKKHHHPYILIERDFGTFLFIPSFNTSVTINQLFVVILFPLIAAIFLGAWIWIKWILKPLILLNEGVHAVTQGKLDHIVPVSRTDELGKLAQSFNKMTAKLKAMIKSKEQMLMDISHEIRSPLTRMKVALELLPDHSNKSKLTDDVNEMETLINHILESGKSDNINWCPTKQPTQMIPFLETIITSFKGRQPAISFHQPATDVIVSLDPKQIKTVLENLLENAIKYSTPQSDPILLTLSSSKKETTITVVDNGIGIPEENLAFIFEPFYRVDPSRSKETGGFGLGLSICKRIMDAHEGTLSIQSQAEKGTSITMIFKH